MSRKYLRKRKKPNIGRWIALVLLVASAVVIWAVLSNAHADDADNALTKREEKPFDDTTVSTPEEQTRESADTTAFETEASETAQIENWQKDSENTIETPYLTLFYPEALSDHLRTVNSSENPYILEFYAALEDREAVRLFDIFIGSSSVYNLGVIETEQGEMTIGMITYSLPTDETWSDAETDTFHAMQEAVNDLIACLPLKSQTEDGPSISTEIPQSNLTDFLSIETRYTTLHYPSKWSEMLATEAEENTVEFYYRSENGSNILLFTIAFHADVGVQLGVLQTDDGANVPVSLVLDEIDTEGLGEDEITTAYAMQESVNELVAELDLF